MRILIATDTYTPNVNGAAYFTKRLAEELAKRGNEVFVICPALSFQNTLEKINGVINCRIRSISVPIYKNFRVCPTIFNKQIINKVIQQVNPDVIHIQNHFMIGKTVANFADINNIPIVGTNHFMSENLIHYFHLPVFASNWLQEYAWKQCIDIFEKVDLVTTPTSIAAELLKKQGYSKDVHTISCGIDLQRFNTNNCGKYLLSLYNIPINKKILLYVGRMDKEKQVHIILQALQKLKSNFEKNNDGDSANNNDLHLVLAGIGNEKINLEKLANELGINKYVTFTGFVPDSDLQNIYAIADIFVIAGIAELQSIVTMEAMATGLPVIAANAMALPELVHDNENGFLFPAGDFNSLSEKISLLLHNENLYKKMSGMSLNIIQKHNINIIMNNYEEIYEKAINH